MDNVLFYGERDEASRRQVRSAAAAHSHRIGPRKPKAALKQAAKDAPSAAPSASSTATASKRRSAQPHKSRSEHAASASNAQAAQVQDLHRPAAPSSGAASAGLLRPPNGTGKSSTARANITTTTTDTNLVAPPAGLPMAFNKAHTHPHPALRSSPTEHLLQHTAALLPNRPSSSQEQVQRLPQYSWTEYPRYALSSTRVPLLDVLADAASSAHDAGSTPPDSSLPDLRHFEKSADGRPILPPLSEIQQQQQQQRSAVDGARPSSTDPLSRRADADAPRYNPCTDFLQHARPLANRSPMG